ncbi:hypothetical protein MTP04_34310 [Lysinibacillus sp. PLM2]|nr:hypothetical protein MTP04_34310 [Lysinibacillus sp. PLM2]
MFNRKFFAIILFVPALLLSGCGKSISDYSYSELMNLSDEEFEKVLENSDYEEMQSWQDKYDYDNSSSSTNSNLFSYLEIKNISYTHSGSWYSAVGEITNTYHKPLGGYLDIVGYDSEGNIINSMPISLPLGGIQPKETWAFKQEVSKTPFNSVKVQNSTVVVED